MDYIDLATVKLHLPQQMLPLTVQNGTKVVNDALLGQKISIANSLADAYLRERYKLPLTQVDGFLQEAVLHIIQFLLSDGLLEEESAVRQKYQSAVQTLSDLMKGKLSLSVDPKSQAVVDFETPKARFKQRLTKFWEAH